jgi:hypothetical protein
MRSVPPAANPEEKRWSVVGSGWYPRLAARGAGVLVVQIPEPDPSRAVAAGRGPRGGSPRARTTLRVRVEGCWRAAPEGLRTATGVAREGAGASDPEGIPRNLAAASEPAGDRSPSRRRALPGATAPTSAAHRFQGQPRHSPPRDRNPTGVPSGLRVGGAPDRTRRAREDRQKPPRGGRNGGRGPHGSRGSRARLPSGPHGQHPILAAKRRWRRTQAPKGEHSGGSTWGAWEPLANSLPP